MSISFVTDSLAPLTSSGGWTSGSQFSHATASRQSNHTSETVERMWHATASTPDSDVARQLLNTRLTSACCSRTLRETRFVEQPQCATRSSRWPSATVPSRYRSILQTFCKKPVKRFKSFNRLPMIRSILFASHHSLL